jgi:hypothetical protein
MHRRSLLTVAVAAAALVACAPSIEKPAGNPASTDYVVFDPATSQIPLPNDLALQTAATAQGAQGELLKAFVAQGGFPNDQEVPITIDVQRFTYGASTPAQAAPPEPVDPATLVLFPAPNATIAVFEKKAGAPAAAPVDPSTLEVKYVPPAATSATGPTDRGTITLENKPHAVTLSAGDVIQSRRWNAGSQYVVLVRGGASGVKLQGGGALTAMPTMFFLTQGQDLSLPQNQYLLPGDGRQGRAATGDQLEAIRQSYLKAGLIQGPTSPGAAELAFGAGATKDLLSIQTFQIAAAPAAGAPSTFVVTDASAGIVPLPSDLLLDPATNKVVNNPAFGGLASGIATLDGFSTTAMVLSQTTAPVIASTVAGSVFLYDLSNPAAPVRLKEIAETAPTFAGAAYVAEPFLITQKPTGPTATAPCIATDPATGCFSTAIGLQPAVGAPVSATTQINLPPLKEGTEYAVLVTDGVLDASGVPTASPGKPLQRSTLSRILLFDNALVDATGKSQLTGQPDATAAGLEKIRQGVGAAAKALAAEKPALTKDHIVLGYTFRTQSITQTSLQLAAAPYQTPAAFVPTSSGVPVTAAFTGVVPLTNVQEIRSVPITTLNPINVQTGALEPDSTKWTPASLNALVVVPATTGTPASPTLAPLVVFQHGLGRNKGDVGPIASALATAGFVVAAIDAPLHGDRAYCAAPAGSAECTCTGGSPTCTTPTCTFFGPAGLQGDTVQIGQCTAGSVAVPAVSGRFLVTANFFRTRDALRQDILDVSALVLALAPLSVPSNPLAAELLSKGIAIDPTKVYWIGQSLGGILGTLNTAANPRISRAVLNVPGATVVDVFTQSPSFTPQVNLLLAGLGITPGTPQYLQFIQVAKLVLDGAEPLNFGGHLLGDAAHPTLPDLLQSKPNQAAKNVFGQYAICDQVIPNPFNLLLLGEIGLTSGTGPNPFSAYTVTGAGTLGACNTDPTTNPAHGFLLNGIDLAATGAGQADAAGYLFNLAVPAATRP